MPGCNFASPQDLNELHAWLPLANARQSRARRARPIDLIEQDQAMMRPLSPVAPDVLFRNTVRPPRDYYVRALSNDYSVFNFEHQPFADRNLIAHLNWTARVSGLHGPKMDTKRLATRTVQLRFRCGHPIKSKVRSQSRVRDALK
jgi:hypothetical protein